MELWEWRMYSQRMNVRLHRDHSTGSFFHPPGHTRFVRGSWWELGVVGPIPWDSGLNEEYAGPRIASHCHWRAHDPALSRAI